jgi:hypothetical protein
VRDRVRIDDLARPRWPEAAQPFVEGLTAHGEALGIGAIAPDRVMVAANEQTGLDTWGDGAFRERLEVLCAALQTEAGLSPFGIALTYESLVQTLRGRLLVEDLIGRHPEIEDVPIAAPIVICGLPRTGTTHLHNLLSAHPGLRHLPYWESLEPVLPPDEAAAVAGGAPDPRRERTAAAVEIVDTCMPLFRRMHEMTVDHAHEEIQLLALDVSGMFFETTSLMPTWRDHYTATDQTPSYRYLARVLRALTWLRGGDRWVLKSPQHLEQLGPLAATFPDATFVVTHRDPVAVTASTAAMITYAARMRVAAPDPLAHGAYWSSRVQDLLLGGLRDRDALPAGQVVDVVLDDLVADDMGVVERIYATAGQSLDDRARSAMAAFASAHPRGRHGTVEQDLAVLGIDAQERRRALAEYAERFGLRDEGLR